MQPERIALRKIPEGYSARKFVVHVGGPPYRAINPEGYEGVRIYKTERGAMAFAQRAADHYGKTVYVEESWQRDGGWWVSGLYLEGQISVEVLPS